MTSSWLGTQGWQPDPFGRHESRYFSAGTPTALVRDGDVEGNDPPTRPDGPRAVSPSPAPVAPAPAPPGPPPPVHAYPAPSGPPAPNAYPPPNADPWATPAANGGPWAYPGPAPTAGQPFPVGATGSWPTEPATPPELPRELRAIVVLLIVNLVLSVGLTVITLFARHSIVNYQLDHRHITDPAMRETLRKSYVYTIVGRGVGNLVASVVYVFLVRALFRGRRWAYRRVIWLGGFGGLALLLAQASPYPLWMHVEQLLQILVLFALVFVVTRPPVRAYFAKGLPGRDVRRFRR